MLENASDIVKSMKNLAGEELNEGRQAPDTVVVKMESILSFSRTNQYCLILPGPNIRTWQKNTQVENSRKEERRRYACHI